MKCEKKDNGLIKGWGVSVKNRKILFYAICIWIRFALVYLSYIFYDRPWFLYVAAGITLYTIISKSFDKDHCVWWSRKFHYIIRVLIFITAIIQLILKYKDNEIKHIPVISYLLLADILFGLIYSLLVKWF